MGGEKSPPSILFDIIRLMKTRISVVIPAYNEEKYIDTCLKCIFNQTIDKKLYEVIVVVRKDTNDKTVEIAKKYPVQIIYVNGGVGEARYKGYKNAKGDIFAGTDADTQVSRQWLEVIMDTFNDPNIVSVRGPILLTNDSSLMHKIAFKLSYTLYDLIGSLEGKVYIAGNNFAVRKTAYNQAGGFNPNLKSGEDTDLTRKICKYGKTVVNKQMIVHTSPRRIQEGYARSFFRYVKIFIFLKIGKLPPDFPHYR